jgi:hypothetical protein
MMKRSIFAELVELKRRFLDSIEPRDMKDYDGKSFTRKRRLTLAHLLTLVLRCSPYSLQIRVDDFFKESGRKGDVVTKQAFSKARTNLDPEVVKSSFLLTAQTMSGAEDLHCTGINTVFARLTVRASCWTTQKSF